MLPRGTLFKFVDKYTNAQSETFIIKDIDKHGDYYVDFYERIRLPHTSDVHMPSDTIVRNNIIIITNNKTEINMERNLKLTIEQAQKIYKEQPSMRELLLTSFTKEELEGVILRYWVEIGEKSGFYIGSDSMIYSHLGGKDIAEFNVFATKEQAKSALAMAQLSQLMKDLGDECNVDWTKIGVGKSCIKRIGHKLYVETAGEYYYFLAFKTREVALAFMRKHEQLIKDYFMI